MCKQISALTTLIFCFPKLYSKSLIVFSLAVFSQTCQTKTFFLNLKKAIKHEQLFFRLH